MVGSFYISRVLEIGFGSLSAIVAILVIILALRVSPALTLSIHRRALSVFVTVAILIVSSEVIGVVASLSDETTLADVVRETAELVAISSVGFGLYLMRRVERDEVSSLRRSANTDELTGLSSRAFVRRAGERRIALCLSNDIPLACILLDIDDFKRINDRYGHEVGDRTLRSVARVLRESARADDLVGRYGGEEFLVLASGELENAADIADRIRRNVERECVPEIDESLASAVTVSVGVAPLGKGTSDLARMIGAADAEMYRAKGAGKNRVSVFGGA